MARLPPRVSVVIPCYNSGTFLRSTVLSVLTQTFADLELIAIDDGSTDDTAAQLQELARNDARMRVVTRENRGLVATLNEGIALARGEIFARLDHDDIAKPERIARQVAFLDTHADVVAVGCNIEDIDADGRVLRSRTAREEQRHLPLAFPPELCWLPGPTLTARQTVIDKIGGYRAEFASAEDRDLCWRLGAVGRAERLAEPLVQHRVHTQNMSDRLRRKQLTAHMFADLTAIAAALDLDAGPLLDDYRRQESGAILDLTLRFLDLIRPRHPIVDTYWLFFLTRFRAWPLAGYASGSDVLWDVARHLAQRPFDWHRLNLARKAVRYTRMPAMIE